MRSTNIGGSLPSDMATGVRDGAIKIRLERGMEGDLQKELLERSPEELAKYLSSTGKDKRLTVRYEVKPSGSVLVLGTKNSNDKATSEVINRRLDLIVEQVAKLVPELNEQAEALRVEISSQSCPSCKAGGVIRTFMKTVRNTMLEKGLPLEDMIKALPSEFHVGRNTPIKPVVLPKVVGREERNYDVAIPESIGGPRPTCLDCCRKHIGKAVVQMGEKDLGYPNHFWLAMANLSEVEEEALAKYPDFSALVREMRLEMTDDRTYKPDLMQLFDMIDDLEGGSPENVENQ